MSGAVEGRKARHRLGGGWPLAALLAFAAGGCSWFKSPSKENIDPPAELTEFTATVGVQQLWSRNLGEGSGKAGLRLRPAFGDGKVYASDIEGGVYAFDAGSGNQVWHAELSERVGSGPGVGEGLVVVGGLDGTVVAFDADDGSERWSARVSSEVIATPAVGGGIVVVRAHDGRMFGLAAADGTRRWVFDRGVPLLTLRGNGAPLISGDTVYAGYDNGKIVALALENGNLKWEQAVAQSEGRTELERMVDIDGEMGATGAEVYAVSYRGQVGTLALDTGRQMWTREADAYGGLAIAGNALYFSNSDGAVVALDARSGSSLWQQDGFAHRWLSTPAVVGDHVVLGDFEGYVHVLRTEDGALAGRARVGDEAIRSAPLAVGDTVYVASSDGELAALRIGGG